MDLFGESHEFCKYCIHARQVSETSDMLCKKKGIVPQYHTCKKFVFSPLSLKGKRMHSLNWEKFRPEDFKID